MYTLLKNSYNEGDERGVKFKLQTYDIQLSAERKIRKSYFSLSFESIEKKKIRQN